MRFLELAFLYLAPERATRLAIDALRRRSGLIRKEKDLGDGVRYAYLEGGAGEPLMLLHGFGGNKDHFVRVGQLLTPHFRVIVPDHIGFGESAHPPDADYHPAAQVQRLRAFARAIGIQRLHLGGSSMGGHIAMTYAAFHPTEVASLWLLDPGGVPSAPQSEVRRIIEETGRNPLMARNEDEFARTFAIVMSDPPRIPRPVLDVMARERIRNYDLELGIFQQYAESAEEHVAGLTIPTLIVWGDQDRVLHSKGAEILHKLLPRSRVIIMPGVGHLPMIERPKQTAEDYLQFRSSCADV